jgi:hypothetical protein
MKNLIFLKKEFVKKEHKGFCIARNKYLFCLRNSFGEKIK